MSSGHQSKPFAFDLNVEAVDDDNCDSPDNSDLCSICLEPLVNNHRTLVTLKCNHKFHLDCIGSAFNGKGQMQCPYCMQIEPGQWQNTISSPIDSPIADFSIPDWFAQVQQMLPLRLSIEMIFGGELCPFRSLEPQYSIEEPNLLGHNIFSDEPARSERHQECSFMEYCFSIPQSSSAALGINGSFSFNTQWTTDAGEVPNPVPSNRRIFWDVVEPGLMRGRHYLSHPFLDHIPFWRSHNLVAKAPLAPMPYPGISLVAPPYPDSILVAPPYLGSSSVAPPYLGSSSVAPPYLGSNSVAPPYLGSSSVANAPVFSTYPNSSTMQLNQIPSLLGDLSAPVLHDHVFPSGREQHARGVSNSLSTSSGSEEVNDDPYNLFHAWEAAPYTELAQQFKIERDLYLMMIKGGDNGAGGSGGDGGSGEDGNGDHEMG